MPMDMSGNTILVTASDSFTKWVEARVVPREDAFNVTEALVGIFTSMRLPGYIRSDRGSVFRSHVMKRLADVFGAKLKFGSSYHPQSQGQIERWHRSFLMTLRSFGQQFANCWSAALPLLLYCYRTTPSTTTGVTPFRAMFGRDARDLPIDGNEFAYLVYHMPGWLSVLEGRLSELRDLVDQNITKASQDNIQQRDSRVRNFQKGDSVGLRFPPKLTPNYELGWKVEDVSYPVVLISHPKHSSRRVHINRLVLIPTRSLNIDNDYDDGTWLLDENPNVDSTSLIVPSVLSLPESQSVHSNSSVCDNSTISKVNTPTDVIEKATIVGNYALRDRSKDRRPKRFA
ncbi:hypothetical protein FOL47_001714 [Perkinsus chesapeaki]|uniref:Integrase catalytic domain-containing protein n=1 Tax=Perkinsus chesapeaki TaxID=330153 RepID=A0A7J6MHH7_PERCH|nr:hypothetical protein FOL47_001714 [Perkinsus chesapeaki]